MRAPRRLVAAENGPVGHSPGIKCIVPALRIRFQRNCSCFAGLRQNGASPFAKKGKTRQKMSLLFGGIEFSVPQRALFLSRMGSVDLEMVFLPGGSGLSGPQRALFFSGMGSVDLKMVFLPGREGVSAPHEGLQFGRDCPAGFKMGNDARGRCRWVRVHTDISGRRV